MSVTPLRPRLLAALALLAVTLLSLILGAGRPPGAAAAQPVAHHYHRLAVQVGDEPPLLPGPSQPSNQGPFFQIVCLTGQRLPDDPIVFPGQPGASHKHQFFGARATTAVATYERLVLGGTTCTDPGDTAAYWVPTLYDAQGVLRSPRRVRAYYYANAADRGALRAFPPNLRMIAGDARATGVQPRGVIQWMCRNRVDQSAGRPLLSEAPPRCGPDAYLSLSIRFPDCWDGAHLDSSDHRRHMAYADEGARCPASHPVKLPKLRLSITYEDGAFTGGDFTLGGPRGSHHALPWSAMHAGVWNSWQQAALEQYVDGCLRHGRTVRRTACQ